MLATYYVHVLVVVGSLSDEHRMITIHEVSCLICGYRRDILKDIDKIF